jgi:hypothetical protein
MANILDRLHNQMSQAGLTKRTAEARTWLRGKIADLQNVRRNAIINDRTRKVARFEPGKMFFFFYEAKTKETLPYFDRFPLVIPIEMNTDGFLGLNLHYLPVKYRLILLDKLYTTLNNEAFNDSTKMQINYNLLSGASRYQEFKPCLKRYLNSHVSSGMIEIEPDNWETAIFLPVEMFVGANKSQVHRDSLEMF